MVLTVWTPTDDGFANISNHDSFTNGAPYNTFERLRRDDPVSWTEWEGGKPYWSITRYEDILDLISKTDLLTSAEGIRMEDQTPEEFKARRTFQETDGQEHMHARLKVARAFSNKVIAEFETTIRALCSDILDTVLEQETFDATKQIARELPMRMLGRILGIPDEDLPWLVEKGDALIANTDSDFTDFVADKLETDAYRMMPFNSPAGAELYDYADALMERKEQMGDTSGILHMIQQPARDGSSIAGREFKNFFCLLVAAGNDTTRYSIAAGIQALCHQPELLAQLKSAPADQNVADEIIRWASPATHFRRTATRDFDLHGRTIKKGDKVLYWFVSGNRDEAVFDDPYRVDFHRTPNRHLAFGRGGPHVCLGMWLARLEVRVLFDEIAKRISTIEPAGPQKFVRSNFVNGLKELPVTVTLS